MAGSPAAGRTLKTEYWTESINQRPLGVLPGGRPKIETSEPAGREKPPCGKKKVRREKREPRPKETKWAGRYPPLRLSKEGRREDALALGADERRDKLRKAAGRGTCPLIRRYLNGGTHLRGPQVSMHKSIVHGGGPGELKHLSSRRKRKQK